MADPNGRWEATDAIRDPQPPRRRLASVAISGELCLLREFRPPKADAMAGI
jgi:hypothetical protein